MATRKALRIPDRKPRTRQGIIDYLTSHERYHTANSWNLGHSYAHNVKVHNLDIPHEDRDKCYEALEVEDWVFEVNHIIREFEDRHDGQWTIGFNGRSGGYMVLYRASRRPSQYKSRCIYCGQRNFKSVVETGDECGVCHKNGRRDFDMVEQGVSSESVDPDPEEFEDKDYWPTSLLRERLDVVRDFDMTCLECVETFLEFARTHKVVDDTIMVEKQVRVAVPLENGATT